ncbi:MAG: hypothetical protein WD794_00095 [Mycobacteriales bacterium]
MSVLARRSGGLRRGRSRGAIITAAGPRMRAALHDLALPTFRRYAEVWDWTVVVQDLSHLHPQDFQALVLEQVPAEHRVTPNTGVWLLRSCAQSFAFLDAVEDAGQQPGPWADQGAVLHALGWDRGDDRHRWARPGAGNAFSCRTSWLPPGWNMPYLDGRCDSGSFNSGPASYLDRPQVRAPHALHFMGMTPVARYRHMASVATAQEQRLRA